LVAFFADFFAAATLPFTVALRLWPALKPGAFEAATRLDSPVSGLRDLRAARLRTTKLPKPVIATLSRFFSALAITRSAGWKMALGALVASLRVTFSCSLSASIISARFMLVSRWLWTARKNSVVRKRRQ